MDEFLILILLLLGFISVVVNTIVGGGGGVVMVPALILFFGHAPNDSIATSFVVITIGATVSTLAYARQGRVDYRAGLPLAALTLPGTVIGALISTYLQASVFQLLLGAVILVVALLPLKKQKVSQGRTRGGWNRKFTDSFGTDYSYTIRTRVAVLSALLTGFTGGIFGAAGGLVLMPGFVLAGFPVHVALATVRFVAVILAFGASLTRFYLGQVDVPFAVWLSVGAVAGAVAGARLARVLKDDVLGKIVSVGISLLGLALILKSIF